MKDMMSTLSRRDIGCLIAATTVGAALPAHPLLADGHEDYVEQSLGNPDADVVVIEYASFTCVHCKTFHERNFPRLKADYIDTGLIEFRLRDVYFDRKALWVALIARCGGSDKYFPIVDQMFRQQAHWSRFEDAQDLVKHLKSIGLAAGLTNAELNRCLADKAAASTLVAAANRFKAQHGIESTPSFVIDGRTHRNMSYGDLAALIDDALDS